VFWEEVGNPSNSGNNGPFTGNATIDFPSAGTYQVKISGDFPRIYFNNRGDRQRILTVDQWGDQVWSNMNSAFRGCTNLKIVASDTPDLSIVEDMFAMFLGCSTFNENIDSWDVSNVKNMTSLFAGASNFDQPLNSWSVENVESMAEMFLASSFNQPLDTWDVENTTTMRAMFAGTSSFNQPLDMWSVGNVTNMSSMFSGANSFNQPLANWNLSDVTRTDNMFRNAAVFDQGIGSWDISGIVGNMTNMFTGSGLSQENYETTLQGWATLDAGETRIPQNVNLGANGLEYCDETARNGLINEYGWMITGDVQDPTCIQAPFITTWKTDNPGSSSDTQITIPTTGTGYDYIVFWEEVGNPSNSGNNGPFTGDAIIDFPSIGTYQVSISGDFPRIYFNHAPFVNENDHDKILSVDQWGDQQWDSFFNAFKGCSNLEVNASDIPDLSNVVTMKNMFSNATSFNQDISNWDLSNVLYINGLFSGATSFNQDISSWDISNVISMTSLFSDATSFNQDMSSWDISNVTNLSSLFSGASSFDQNISGWDVGHITDMSGIFSGATSFNQDISGWDVSSVTDMGNMFSRALSFDQDISGWDVSSVEDMSNMFFEFTTFNQDIGGWDVSSVSNMSSMFRGASTFNQNIGDWDVSNVTDVISMFSDATSFNQDLSSWDLRNVLVLTQMFFGATSFDQNLADWDVVDVFDMSNMLSNTNLSPENYDATLLGWVSIAAGESPIRNNVILGAYGLEYCDETARNTLINDYGWTITGDTQEPSCLQLPFITAWQTDNPGTSGDTQITIPTTGSGYDYIVSWEEVGNPSNTGTTGPFTGDATIDFPISGIYQVSIIGDFPRIYFNNTGDKQKILNISQWGDQEWSSMRKSFHGCNFMSLSAIDDPDLTSATDLSYMFSGSGISNEDISSWDVSGVTDMSFMFRYAYSFNGDISTWDVGSVTNMSHMFESISFNQDISSWDVSSVIDMSYLFYEASLFNHDISNWDVSNVTDMSYIFHDANSFAQNIGNWDVSNVSNMTAMFFNATSFDQSLDSWDISEVQNMNLMLSNSGLSESNYDATLEGWATLSPMEAQIPQNITLGASGLIYCESESNRADLINTYNWTISGDLLNCFESGARTAGTDRGISNNGENSEVEIEIVSYPNPVDRILFLSGSELIGGRLTLFDLKGNTVIESNKVEENKLEVSTFNLSSGIYLVKFTTKEGVIYEDKIVVKH